MEVSPQPGILYLLAGSYILHVFNSLAYLPLKNQMSQIVRTLIKRAVKSKLLKVTGSHTCAVPD